MQLIVHKSPQLSGKIVPPSSKSQTIRALLFALLSKGQSTLLNPLGSEDARDALRTCQALGVDITIELNAIHVTSSGLPLQSTACTLYTGNSGITTRFILPLLGLRKHTQQPIIVDCGEQMRARPIHSLVQALNALGMSIHYQQQQGALPLSITGPLKGGRTEVNGLTSQYLSALLIALPCAAEDSEITVNNLHERPYVEMTVDWLRKQSIQFSHQREQQRDIYFIKGGQRYLPFQLSVPGDFSSASYLIAAAVLLGKDVEINGLDMQSSQGDKRIVAILQAMGADITVDAERLSIQSGCPLTGIKIDANDVPDLLPTLAVIGCFAQGKTEIHNVPQARIKETDRVHSMAEGLRKLGAKIDEYPDGLTVYHSQLKGAEVKGYDDHRTVMALAVAGMMADGTTTIDDAEAIDKTFPTFVALMQSMGAPLEVQHGRD